MTPALRRTHAAILRSALAVGLLAGAGCHSPSGPEPRWLSALRGETVLTLHVAAARVPCMGVGPMECLQVRERPDAPWQLFYDGIEGFTYEPGHAYVLRLAVREVPDPPADGSSRAYRLLAVLSKTPAP